MSAVFTLRRWGAGCNPHPPIPVDRGWSLCASESVHPMGGGGCRILNQPILSVEGRGRSLGSIHSAVGERDRATTLVLFPHRV